MSAPTTQAASSFPQQSGSRLATAGAATGILAILFSTSPVVLHPSLPLALLALVLTVLARRVTHLNRNCGRFLALTGMALSTVAAAVVVGLT